MTRWTLLLPLLVAAGWAMAGLEPDPAFGDQGRVTQAALGPTGEGIVAMRVDGQDRIVSAYGGLSGRGVSRHLADGTLDPDFGTGGRVVLDFVVRDLVVQHDGRIVVVGGDTGSLLEQDWRIVRLLPDGGLDASFGDGGEIVLDWFGSGDEALSIALASDGRLVVGGRALDPSAGTAFAVAIFDTQGDLAVWRADKLFAGTADICNRVLIQPDGKIVCAGLARNPGGALMAVVRYQSSLEIDSEFGTDGLATVTFAEGPAEAQDAMLLSEGDILLGGFVEDAGDYALALARLTATGALDTDFSTDGRAMAPIAGSPTESIFGLLELGDRTLAVVLDEVRSDFVVAGFTAAGELDADFGSAGLSEIDFNGRADFSVAIVEHQGQVLVGGSVGAEQRAAQTDLGLARLTPDGALDSGFALGGRRQDGLTGPVTVWTSDAVLRDDGGVITVGYTGPTLSSREFLVSAFNADGTLDTSFGEQGSLTADFDNEKDVAHAVARLADGRLLVAGVVRPEGGTDDFAVARFLADGTIDTSFGVDGWTVVDLDGSTDTLRDLAVQADGGMLLAGEGFFPNSSGTRDFAIVRLDSDGALDSAFGSNGVARVSIDTFDEAAAIGLLAGGDVILGGSSDGDYVIIRFKGDGSLDTTFGDAGVVIHDFLGQFDFMRDLVVIDDWEGQGERILAAGMARNGGSSPSNEDFAAVLFETDGALEAGFGSAGQVVQDLSGGQDQAAAVAIADSALVLAGRVGSPQDFGALALSFGGQPDTEFFVSGSIFTLDFAGSVDEVAAVLSGSAGLLLAGQSFDPAAFGGIQSIALVRLARSERIFRDRFESP
jgi:uncharacterized delta-60 repeat protein